MRKMTCTATRVALCAALAISFGAAAQAAEALSWKFTKGEKVNYAMSTLNHRLIDAGGAEFDIDMGLTTDVTWAVDSVDADGNAELTQTIDRVQLKFNSPLTGEVVYDSKAEDAEPIEGPIWERMGPVMEAMVGGEFKVKVTKRGEVTELTFPEKLKEVVDEQAAAAGEGGGGGGSFFALIMGGNMFSEKGFKDAIQRGIVIFPESPEAEWNSVLEDKMGDIATIKFDTKYTRDGAESRDGKDLEKIGTKTEMTFELAEGAEDGDVIFELVEQEGSGSVLFDPKAGRTVESKSTQKSVMEGEAMGNEIAIESETTLVVVQGTSENLPKDEATEEAPAEDKPAESDSN